MKTTLNADGKIGIPDEIRQTDHLTAGDSFELERLTPGHYLLTKPPSGYGTASPQRVCPPKPWRRRNSIFSKPQADVLDHPTSDIARGGKLGIDATKKLPGERFKRPRPPFIKMDAAVKANVEKFFNS